MARTKSPTSDSAATIGFEATALHDSATRRCKATLRSLLRSREANKAKDNRSNNTDDKKKLNASRASTGGSTPRWRRGRNRCCTKPSPAHCEMKPRPPSSIPTGLHPSAQGCAPRATLGHAPQYIPQPQRGCITVAPTIRCNPVGVDDVFPRSPRVASRPRQPWANRFYPVGVIELDGRPAASHRLARLYERKHAALEAWKKSLLLQAFAGEL